MADQEVGQPHYRVVSKINNQDIEDELNRLATDGYRFVAQIENKVINEQPAFTVLVELSDEAVA
jgi:hypothetical protein